MAKVMMNGGFSQAIAPGEAVAESRDFEKSRTRRQNHEVDETAVLSDNGRFDQEPTANSDSSLEELDNDMSIIPHNLFNSPTKVIPMDEDLASDDDFYLNKATEPPISSTLPKLTSMQHETSFVKHPSHVWDLHQVLFEYTSHQITVEDFKSLDKREMLTNTALDFCLAYIFNQLSDELRDRIHILETSFFSLLTTSTDSSAWKECQGSTSSAKRYQLLEGLPCLESVNLFDKDFIIIPCIENQHWFLAIVCYPKLSWPETALEGIAVSFDDSLANKKKGSGLLAIRRPCILIFDSAFDAVGRSVGAAIKIRNYLDELYKDKHQSQFEFRKENIVDSVVVVSIKKLIRAHFLFPLDVKKIHLNLYCTYSSM